MNFFEHQAKARRNTSWLVVLFGLSVALIILACYVPGVVLANYLAFKHAYSTTHRHVPEVGTTISWWRADILGYATAAAVTVIAAGSLWKIRALGGGGAAVAAALGGRALEAGTASGNERKLLNVVEEMAIASGVGVPRVFVMDEERGINALAAGYSPNDAAVVVTRGCVEHLSRDELQGVIAHEFSHILNGDMRLNIRLIGLIHGILVIGLVGKGMLRVGAEGSRFRSSRQSGGALMLAVLVGAFLAAIGCVGVFFGRAIKAAVCRQREFLADASAVNFTRNPDGLTGALKKIGGVRRKSILLTDAAEEFSHMSIGAAVAPPIVFGNLLATHPPLVERIRRIDPAFDGNFPKIELPPGQERQGPARAGGPEAAMAAVSGFQRPETMTIDPDGVVAQVGVPTIDHLAYGAALLNMLPSLPRAAAREPTGAMAVVYALLLDADQEKRESQITILREQGESGVLEEVLRLRPIVALLHPGLKLPMAELAVPALRRLSPAEYAAFRRNIGRLIAADRRIDVFEFAMHKLLVRRLASSFGQVDRQVVRYRAITPLLPDCRIVLSVLAHAGNRDAEAAGRTFDSAAAKLWKPAPGTAAPSEPSAPPAGPGTMEILPIGACGLKALDQALDRLASASPIVKERMVDACARCVVADGTVTVKEAELLRAITDALDCPLPPFLPSLRTEKDAA